jgi:hypothetical protein
LPLQVAVVVPVVGSVVQVVQLLQQRLTLVVMAKAKVVEQVLQLPVALEVLLMEHLQHLVQPVR